MRALLERRYPSLVEDIRVEKHINYHDRNFVIGKEHINVYVTVEYNALHIFTGCVEMGSFIKRRCGWVSQNERSRNTPWSPRRWFSAEQVSSRDGQALGC